MLGWWKRYIKKEKKNTQTVDFTLPWEPQPRRVFGTRVGSGRELKYSAFEQRALWGVNLLPNNVSLNLKISPKLMKNWTDTPMKRNDKTSES